MDFIQSFDFFSLPIALFHNLKTSYTIKTTLFLTFITSILCILLTFFRFYPLKTSSQEDFSAINFGFLINSNEPYNADHRLNMIQITQTKEKTLIYQQNIDFFEKIINCSLLFPNFYCFRLENLPQNLKELQLYLELPQKNIKNIDFYLDLPEFSSIPAHFNVSHSSNKIDKITIFLKDSLENSRISMSKLDTAIDALEISLILPQNLANNSIISKHLDVISYLGGLLFMLIFIVVGLYRPLLKLWLFIEILNQNYCIEFIDINQNFPQKESMKKSAFTLNFFKLRSQIPSKIIKKYPKINVSPSLQIMSDQIEESPCKKYPLRSYLTASPSFHINRYPKLSEKLQNLSKEEYPFNLNFARIPKKTLQEIEINSVHSEQSMDKVQNMHENDRKVNTLFGNRVTCVESEKLSSKELEIAGKHNKIKGFFSERGLQAPPVVGRVKKYGNLTLKFGFMDIINYFLRGCGLKIVNKRVDMVEKGINNMKLKLDIAIILRRFEEIDEFEKILLDKNQYKLFKEYINNKKVVLEQKYDIKNKNFEKMIHSEDFSNFSFNLDLMTSYRFIRKRGSQIDENLLRLLDENFVNALEKINISCS